MAIYRNVQMSFWTDAGIMDNYTPDDRYFYLYLLTNPHTNLCGCYEVSISQMMVELGYDRKKIMSLIDRAISILGSIRYSESTKEILVIRWNKYNWTASEKFRKPLWKEIESIKNDDFRSYLTDLYNGVDTVSIPYAYGIDTTVTVTDTDTVLINNIVDYLNNKCGTKYKPSSGATKKLIRARLNEGYTEQDFQTVIDKKYDEWHGTEQEKYLRPETLFGSKFEGYLNQKINAPKQKKSQNDFDQRNYDYADLNKRLFGGARDG